MSEHPSGPVPEADDDTVVVGDDDPTILVSREEETVPVSREETVMVSREETAPDPGEETLLIPRGGPAPDDEDTVSMSTDRGARSRAETDAAADPDVPAALDAAGGDDDDTVIVADDDATIRVERSEPDLPTVRVTRSAASAVRPAMIPQRSRRRGELRPAPVPSGFGGVPLVASGPGAVSSYRARALVPPSAALAAPDPTAPPDRVLGGAASVRAQSRRVAIWTLAAAAASVVVIAGGMLWAIRDLVGF